MNNLTDASHNTRVIRYLQFLRQIFDDVKRIVDTMKEDSKRTYEKLAEEWREKLLQDNFRENLYRASVSEAKVSVVYAGIQRDVSIKSIIQLARTADDQRELAGLGKP